MSQHEIWIEIPARARNGITRNLSHGEDGSESSAENVSESKRKGAETRVKAGDQRRWERGVEGVKRKEQAIRRAAGDRTRREGVAIFH